MDRTDDNVGTIICQGETLCGTFIGLINSVWCLINIILVLYGFIVNGTSNGIRITEVSLSLELMANILRGLVAYGSFVITFNMAMSGFLLNMWLPFSTATDVLLGIWFYEMVSIKSSDSKASGFLNKYRRQWFMLVIFAAFLDIALIMTTMMTAWHPVVLITHRLISFLQCVILSIFYSTESKICQLYIQIFIN